VAAFWLSVPFALSSSKGQEGFDKLSPGGWQELRSPRGYDWSSITRLTVISAFHGRRAARITSPPAVPVPCSKIRAPSQSPVHIVARLRDAGCVYAEEEARLLIDAKRPHELAALIEQRVAGVPLEYVLGWAEFCGQRIVLEAGVFIPRRRTEFLARQAVELTPPRSTVLDLCCGSGAVGAVLAATVADIDVLAGDIDPVAVRCARRNLAPWGGRVREGDLYAPLPRQMQGRINVLVANAPYVPSKDIEALPREARLHEPRRSLDGGPDGLDVQRRVAEQAARWLAPGGHLLMETGEHQAGTTVEICRRSGLLPRVARSDDWDATVVVATSAIR